MARPKRMAATRSAEKVKLLLDFHENEAVDDADTIVPSSSRESSSSESISLSSIDSDDDDSGTDEDEIPYSARNSRKKQKTVNGFTSDVLRHVPFDVDHVLSEEYTHVEDTCVEESNIISDDDTPKSGHRSKKSHHKRARKGKKARLRTTKLEWECWEEEHLESQGPWGDADDSLDFASKRIIQTTDPSSDILMPLLPFQKEWLWWSLMQEHSDIRGGILADEMGMGKTIQAISLILTSRSKEESQSAGKASSSLDPQVTMNGPLEGIIPVKGTLVICPVVAVIQWRNEVARFTRQHSVKVLVYHGAKRRKDVDELAEADIVLTTYSIVESEYRNTMSSGKVRCRWCQKLFHLDRLAVHQQYYCGPHARKTAKQSKQMKKQPRKGSNMFAKLSSWDQSEDCTAGKTKNAPSGRGRKRKIQEVEMEAAISEAVESLKADDSCKPGEKDFSALHAVKWNRIILDEAHCIKDRKCSTAKSVFALHSNFKWALSGTPLQNRVGELYSLVRFLEIQPYSYYYCKLCDCKSLDYSFNGGRKCNHCHHSALSHFCWWNKFIANPIKRWGYVNEGRKAMMLLKHKLLDSILLRRTKLECAADLALPPSTKFLRRDCFDPREDDFYQALYTQSQSQFNTYIDAGTLVNNYAHIFDLLTRLRQAVDHPYLVVYSKTGQGTSVQYTGQTDAGPSDEICSICSDPFEEPFVTDCNHMFCKACIMEYVAAAIQKPPCPMCQKPLTIDFTSTKAGKNSRQDTLKKSKGIKSSSILSRIDLKQFQTSTKIEALREEITEMLEKDCTAKAIIFSQFTSFLELISFRLAKFGIKCVKLDGSMTLPARDQMIEKFTNDPDCKIFLMSLKAGGVALNLTVASHVFLMDPWWNPAVEQQAQDRIHRLGQYKPIRVVRFVIENTIEERILKLQEKKQLVFEGTVGGSSEALGKLTEGDLRFLFTS